MRKSNRVESTFATVRDRTKGCLSNKAALAMVLKLVDPAQKTRRRLDGHNELPNVVLGAKFKDGLEVGATADLEPKTAG